MRTLRSISFMLMSLALPVFAADDHTPPPVIPASKFPAVEVHDNEKIAIAIEPYENKEKQEIFNIEYAKYGVIPVRLIITNLGEKPISLRDARILFETAGGERIQAAEPSDVERLLHPTNQPKTMPLPGPLPSLKRKPKNQNNEVQQDFDTFEYQALAVEPHTTRAGFLFYVVQRPDPLKGAKIYLNKLRDSEGQELFPFEIPFDKYLQARAGSTN